MKRIALTGGIACGKSLLAKYLNDIGVETLDADDVVHGLIPAEERRRLAKTVFSDPAARKALEARIHPLVAARIEEFFAAPPPPSPDNPPPSADNPPPSADDQPPRPDGPPPSPDNPPPRPDGLPPSPDNPPPRPDGLPPSPDGRTVFGQPPRIAIVPLLFEVQWEKKYDIILCVASSREKQIERMVQSRGYSLEEAEARLAAQMPVAEKAAKSHYTIRNDGTPEELRIEAERLVRWLAARV